MQTEVLDTSSQEPWSRRVGDKEGQGGHRSDNNTVADGKNKMSNDIVRHKNSYVDS